MTSHVTELLEHLQACNAFDPTPRQARLASFHVTFDELCGTSRVESRLDRVIRSSGRAVLIGESGCGKSSAIWSVLDPLVEGVAPISVPVAALRPETVMEPSTVADQLIRRLAQHAEQAGRIIEREEREYLQAAQSRRSVSVGRDTRAGLRWLGAELATDLSRQIEGTIDIGPDEKLEVVEQLLGRIAGADLVPVLVFDDTDRWIQGIGLGDPRRIMESFFGRVLRWAAELGCGVVAAAHTSYLADAAHRRRLLEVVETEIEVPRVPNAQALARLFERRLAYFTADSPLEGASTSDVFHPDAVDALFRWYAYDGAQLRDVVQAAHTALTEACDAGSDRIAAPLIATALATR